MNRCYIFRKGLESVDHLILNCEFVRELWGMIFMICGITWVLPNLVMKFLPPWKEVRMQTAEE